MHTTLDPTACLAPDASYRPAPMGPLAQCGVLRVHPDYHEEADRDIELEVLARFGPRVLREDRSGGLRVRATSSGSTRTYTLNRMHDMGETIVLQPEGWVGMVPLDLPEGTGALWWWRHDASKPIMECWQPAREMTAEEGWESMWVATRYWDDLPQETW